MSKLSEQELARVQEYQNFIHKVLEPKLSELNTLKGGFEQEIEDYLTLSEKLSLIAGSENDYNTLVDIGQGCYMQAVVSRGQDTVFVHIGLGFFTEISIPEVPRLVTERIGTLKQKLSHAEAAVEKVKDDIAEAKHTLLQLNSLINA